MSHVLIERVQAGTYTIKVMHEDVNAAQPRCVYRKAGIETHGEALVRARVWVRWCGYDLDDRAKTTAEDIDYARQGEGHAPVFDEPLKVADTEIKRMIDEEKVLAMASTTLAAPQVVAYASQADVDEALRPTIAEEKADYMERLRKALNG